jgi:ribokinase
VVLGGANTDYLVRGSRLPKPGETLQGDTSDEAPGGKGANQAVAVARLGGRVAFVGRVGNDDRGALFIQHLAKQGVDTRHLRRDPDAQTGVALVMVDGSGEKQILAVPHANGRVSGEDLRRAAAAIRTCRVLLLQLEIPMEVVEEAVGVAKAAGVRVVLDPAPAHVLADALVAQLDVIRPNAREATTLTGVEVHDFASAREAADLLVKRGATAAIVGAGSQGDLLLSPEGEERLPRFPVSSVDATGAGDAFAAAIATGLARAVPWKDLGHLASAAAALKTTKLGAQAGLPRLEEIIAFLDEQGLSAAAESVRGLMVVDGTHRVATR